MNPGNFMKQTANIKTAFKEIYSGEQGNPLIPG